MRYHVSRCGEDRSRSVFHTGCAEKRIKSWLNTLPQTMAASCSHRSASALSVCYVALRTIHAPACATTPVPSSMISTGGPYGVESKIRQKRAYRLRSCGKAVALPVVKRHPSFREEVPPRWYQAGGVLLGQPFLGLNNRSNCVARCN